MRSATRTAVTMFRLVCLLSLLGTISVNAVSAQDTTGLEQDARDAAYAVESLSSEEATRANASKRIEMLDDASNILSSIADRAAAGATASETRTEMTEVARLIYHAYLAGKEAGEYPDAYAVRTIEAALSDLRVHYEPAQSDLQR